MAFATLFTINITAPVRKIKVIEIKEMSEALRNMKKKVKTAIGKGIKILTAGLTALSIGIFSAVAAIANDIPDKVCVVEGKSLSFPNTFACKVASQKASCVEAQKTNSCSRHYNDEVLLFGTIPVKSISVDVVKETYVAPGGETFGIKLYTDGVMIVGMSEVDTDAGEKNPAYEAGIRVGDVIMAINGKTVCTNADVAKIFSESGGDTVKLSLKRNNVGYSAAFKPAKSKSTNTYKAGLWVRDSTAGIGTVTYYDPKTLVFGGLGHGICDVDTGRIMPLMTGDVVRVHISGVQKGVKGTPGEFQGTLEDISWGSLTSNTEQGVFGVLNNAAVKEAVPVAMCQEIKEGDAEIIASVDENGPKPYAVKIERLHFNDNSPTKNMIVRVTDQTLLAKTGGIVQGMSGSPILQNGKLVGALTHVFVNDPERGYGIFAENMINTAKRLEITNQKDVS